MKAKKGVTPVVATALLLTIAVGAVVTAGVFMDDTLQDIRESLGGEVDDQTSNPEYEITSATKGSGNDLNLVVRNTGDTTVDLSEDPGLNLYIDGQPLNGNWQYSGSTQPGIFSPGQTRSINIGGRYPGDNQVIEVTVAGPEGGEAGIICEGGDDQC